MAQHEAAFPAEKAGERNRAAQARYRETHARRLAAAQRVKSVLLRQSWDARDVETLAEHLAQLLGKSVTDDLCKALRKVKRKP